MYNRENVKGYKNPEGRLIHFELTELDDMYKLVPRKYKSKEGQLKLVQDDWGNTSDGVVMYILHFIGICLFQT